MRQHADSKINDISKEHGLVAFQVLYRVVEGRGVWPVRRYDIARRARVTCIGNCVGDDRVVCFGTAELARVAKLLHSPRLAQTVS